MYTEYESQPNKQYLSSVREMRDSAKGTKPVVSVAYEKLFEVRLGYT